MKTIMIIKGDPVLEMDEMVSAGKVVPSAIAYCSLDECLKNYNTTAKGNEVTEVEYTPKLREKALNAILKCYAHNMEKCVAKLKAFDLFKADNIYEMLADQLGFTETDVHNVWEDTSGNKFYLTMFGFKPQM